MDGVIERTEELARDYDVMMTWIEDNTSVSLIRYDYTQDPLSWLENQLNL
jgi:hypothetical protein